jgi:hypothetical protein
MKVLKMWQLTDARLAHREGLKKLESEYLCCERLGQEEGASEIDSPDNRMQLTGSAFLSMDLDTCREIEQCRTAMNTTSWPPGVRT